MKNRDKKNKVAGYAPLSFAFLLVLLMACQSESTSETTAAEATAPASTETAAAPTAAQKTIVFFGNSLTAGYGLEADQSYPSLIQQRIDSLGWPYRVVNAGLSGETTAAGLNRLDWVLQDSVDIFVLELGANDGLRGIPLTETRSNLKNIINQVQQKHPDAQIVLAGMQIPPNMGPEYTAEFRQIFPALAEAEGVHLIPFLLDGVAGDPGLNLPDGIHPNATGQYLVRENVWSVLEPLLRPTA
nr:arylesterase [Catalinimonas alkaloidigena]